ncbi:MAG: hypothetical protein AAF557_01110 [Pseudomonadota bacterium]
MRTPNAEASFDIVLDNPAAEERVMCVAELQDRSAALPKALRKRGLEPMGMRTLEDVLRAHLSVNAENVYHAAFKIRSNGSAAPLEMKVMPPHKPVTIAQAAVKTKSAAQATASRSASTEPKNSDR